MNPTIQRTDYPLASKLSFRYQSFALSVKVFRAALAARKNEQPASPSSQAPSTADSVPAVELDLNRGLLGETVSSAEPATTEASQSLVHTLTGSADLPGSTVRVNSTNGATMREAATKNTLVFVSYPHATIKTTDSMEFAFQIESIKAFQNKFVRWKGRLTQIILPDNKFSSQQGEDEGEEGQQPQLVGEGQDLLDEFKQLSRDDLGGGLGVIQALEARMAGAVDDMQSLVLFVIEAAAQSKGKKFGKKFPRMIDLAKLLLKEWKNIMRNDRLKAFGTPRSSKKKSRREEEEEEEMSMMSDSNASGTNSPAKVRKASIDSSSSASSSSSSASFAVTGSLILNPTSTAKSVGELCLK
jgi:hypothetical protein